MLVLTRTSGESLAKDLNQRFVKAQRLLKRSEYQRLRTQGRKVHTGLFIAVNEESAADRTRLGITVSRRVGKAVSRNRIKRVAREYFRKNRQRIPGQRDIHIIAKQGAAERTNQELFASLETIFRKMGASND